jgi:uncharacterized protein DUF6463
MSVDAQPGRWLRRLTAVHAAIGLLMYRREVREIVRRRFVSSVPYRSEHAAALWFIGSAIPGWTIAHLVDEAAEAGNQKAVKTAGVLGLTAAVGGAIMMPASTFWLQAIACARMLRRGSERTARRPPHAPTARMSAP